MWKRCRDEALKGFIYTWCEDTHLTSILDEQKIFSILWISLLFLLPLEQAGRNQACVPWQCFYPSQERCGEWWCHCLQGQTCGVSWRNQQCCKYSTVHIVKMTVLLLCHNTTNATPDCLNQRLMNSCARRYLVSHNCLTSDTCIGVDDTCVASCAISD